MRSESVFLDPDTFDTSGMHLRLNCLLAHPSISSSPAVVLLLLWRFYLLLPFTVLMKLNPRQLPLTLYSICSSLLLIDTTHTFFFPLSYASWNTLSFISLYFAPLSSWSVMPLKLYVVCKKNKDHILVISAFHACCVVVWSKVWSMCLFLMTVGLR